LSRVYGNWATQRQPVDEAEDKGVICLKLIILGKSEEDAMLDSMKIIAFIPSRNPGRARAFYEEVLGLRFVSEDRFAVVLDANGVMLRIANVPDFKPASFTILGWDVPDIEIATERLQKKGVEFQRYTGMQQDALGVWCSPGGSKVAWFTDPDGNVLSLSQFPASS
jgi:predicted enzyme related to lactoylglutathione lyase